MREAGGVAVMVVLVPGHILIGADLFLGSRACRKNMQLAHKRLGRIRNPFLVKRDHKPELPSGQIHEGRVHSILQMDNQIHVLLRAG
ncbi:hypothetical protein D3C73_1490510 [compost metagenome]